MSEARYVECHMPETNYMVIDARRDHSLRGIGTSGTCYTRSAPKPTANPGHGPLATGYWPLATGHWLLATACSYGTKVQFRDGIRATNISSN